MFYEVNIGLGITGGIAAYKACGLVSYLKKEGANVKVIMTEQATEFITPLTFEVLSGESVVVEMFKRPNYIDVEHISLAKWADIFLVVPATANIIGKIANGISDDMLTTTIMATDAPVLLAPAMNSNMYNNKIVQKNIETLRNYGYKFVGPDVGKLACGVNDVGKLASSEEIIRETKKLVRRSH